jgi:hypothetical protein
MQYMVEDLVVSAALAPKRRPKAVLCSKVRGRERWHVDVLEDNLPFAAAVELVLRTEEGIRAASVNPATGRALVQYDPEGIVRPIEDLLRRALNVNPLSAEEFLLFRANRRETDNASSLLKMEAACFLFRAMFLGALCPFGLAGAAAIFLASRVSRTKLRSKMRLDYTESAATN